MDGEYLSVYYVSNATVVFVHKCVQYISGASVSSFLNRDIYPGHGLQLPGGPGQFHLWPGIGQGS